ncbi:unnamed protein product [Lactuca saligna]|uniref:Uncharacterized protein n=1 Tax=Lactuca saligna TaxID=75948 RepID=A0AA35YIZ3_LACSI|nr:unnamed protein product [Lactuca saligna]
MASLPSILPSAAEYRHLEATYGLSSVEGMEYPSPGSCISSPLCVQMLTPNSLNKVVAFKMICRANNYLPDYFVFKYFFRFCVTRDKYTFSVRRGGHALVPDGRTPKNWQGKWLWVNQELFGSGRYRATAFADTIPKLFPHNQGIADFLKGIQKAAAGVGFEGVGACLPADGPIVM